MPRDCVEPATPPHLRRTPFRFALLLTLVMAALPAPAAQAQTLKAVQERGTLACGVNKGLLGFAHQDSRGTWSGFDVDFCRAVAAAVLGDPSKVRFVPLDVATRFTALQRGSIDLLSRNSTWTLGREAELKLQFPVVTYYDGQGFLARGEKGVLTPEQLGDDRVCVQSGTTHDANATDYFDARGMKIDVVTFPTPAALVKAYESDWCDAITSDVSQLYALRRLMAGPAHQIISKTIISKEPLGPVVRQGDDQWFSIIRWTHFAMVGAEAAGISRATFSTGTGPLVLTERQAAWLQPDAPDPFQALGLAPGAVARIISGVGNYGEVFERNLGDSGKLGIPRGLNRLARDGGLQFAPPLHSPPPPPVAVAIVPAQ